MKIEKAIEILNTSLETTVPDFDQDERDALKLGIEALTFLERWREKAEIKPYPLLPSETTE